MPFNLRAIGVSGYLISDEYLPGATLRMSAPLSESSPVVAMYSMTPVPGIGVYIREKRSSTAWRCAFPCLPGGKTSVAREPATQEAGADGGARARNRHQPKQNGV